MHEAHGVPNSFFELGVVEAFKEKSTVISEYAGFDEEDFGYGEACEVHGLGSLGAKSLATRVGHPKLGKHLHLKLIGV